MKEEHQTRFDSPRPAGRIRAAHLLLNYFALMRTPRREEEVRKSLREVARKLALAQVSDLTEQGIDQELTDWTNKGLVQRNSRGQLSIRDHMKDYYVGVSEDANEELDERSLKILKQNLGPLILGQRSGLTS